MRETGPVRKQLGGDTETASAQISAARTQLGLLKLQMRASNLAVGTRTLNFADGTTVQVSSRFGQDTISITTAQPGTPGISVPQVYTPPDTIYPPIPPNLSIAALVQYREDGNVQEFVVHSSINGLTSTGVDQATNINHLIGCAHGINYTLVVDVPGLFANDLGLISFEIFDLLQTNLSPAKDLAPLLEYPTYQTASGQQLISPPQSPAPRGSTILLPAIGAGYDKNGNPLFTQGMQIVKWTQTSGDLLLWPFVLEGKKKPTVLANANYITDRKSPFYYTTAPGFVNFQIGYDGSVPWGYSWYGYTSIMEQFDWLPTNYLASGNLTFITASGVTATIPINVSARYNRLDKSVGIYTGNYGIGVRTGDVVPARGPAGTSEAPADIGTRPHN